MNEYKVIGSLWRRETGWMCDDQDCEAPAVWRWDIFVVRYGDRPYLGCYLCATHAKHRKNLESQEADGVK